MLEKEDYMKNYFEKECEIILDTILEKYDQITCWLGEKKLNLKM